MVQPSDKSETARHARLFELIRQDNVVNSKDASARDISATDLAGIQQFIKHATKSLHPERDQ